jgi:hypothetical protein
MTKRLKVPLSTARAKLFQLSDLVTQSADETVVILERRGTSGHAALVREARLAYLEARVSEFDRRSEQPFGLAGSLSTALDDETVEQELRAIRREWTAGAQPARTRPRRRGRT